LEREKKEVRKMEGAETLSGRQGGGGVGDSAVVLVGRRRRESEPL